MRRTLRAVVSLILFGLVAAGCGPSSPPNVIEEKLLEKVGEALVDQLAEAKKEADRLDVKIYIDRFRREDYDKVRGWLKNQIESKAKAQTTNPGNVAVKGVTINWSEGGGFYRPAGLNAMERDYPKDLDFYVFHLSPVSDIDALACAVDFGQVRAVDPQGRRLLVVYGEAPAEKGSWKDGAFLAEYLERDRTRLMLDDALLNMKGQRHQMAAKHGGDDRILTLRVMGVPSFKEASEIEGQWRAVMEPRPETSGVGWSDAKGLETLWAPVVDFAAAKKVLTTRADLVASDPERRVIVLRMKPPPAQKPADAPTQTKTR